MSLLRFAARSMLASFFVVNGIKAFRDPEPLVQAAEPLARTFLPLAEKTLPPQAAAYLPEDTKGLVRVTGLAQVIGGISLATGIGRRLGAGVLSLTMLPHLLASNPFKAPAGERDAMDAILLRNVALTGGVLLAAWDTEGRPNLAWRARTRAEAVGREAEHTRAALARGARHTKASLVREAQHTKATVVRQGKRAARRAKKAADKATKGLESVLS